MIKLVCIDVDGTLIGHSGEVLPKVWAAAGRARAAGIRLAIASGRPAYGKTRDYATQLDPTGWHIFQNGASVVNVATGASSSVALPAATVTQLIARARQSGRILELYNDVDYVVESSAPMARAHAALLGLPFVNRPFESIAPPVVRAQWLVPHAETAAVIAEPVPDIELSPSVSPIMPDTSFIAMTGRGVDKGSGVKTVAARYGVDLEHVMAIGDADNDLASLRIVGWPVAMGNADDAVKAIARSRVGTVDDGGVAEALALAIDSRR